MPIRGEELEFDLQQIQIEGAEYVALHVSGSNAQVWCRWELEANRYQVAAARSAEIPRALRRRPAS